MGAGGRNDIIARQDDLIKNLVSPCIMICFSEILLHPKPDLPNCQLPGLHASEYKLIQTNRVTFGNSSRNSQLVYVPKALSKSLCMFHQLKLNHIPIPESMSKGWVYSNEHRFESPDLTPDLDQSQFPLKYLCFSEVLQGIYVCIYA